MELASLEPVRSMKLSTDQNTQPICPLQGADLDVDPQAGISQKAQKLEIATKLIKDIHTISLVLPPGAVFQDPVNRR
jgi:hypothetical protein